MISWYMRRFRSPRSSRVSFFAPRMEAMEDRCTPANLTAGSPFPNSVVSPNALDWSIQTGDFNADGIDDFISHAGSGSNKIAVYQGTGTGTFTLKSTLDVGAANFFGTVQTNSVVFNDFVGVGGTAPDGKADIAIIDSAFNAVAIFPSNGTGTYSTAAGFITTPTTFQRISMQGGDFNFDGLNDLFVGRFGGGGPNGTAGEYDVLLNNGDGTFTTTPRSFTNGLDWIAQQPIVTDLNADGKLDVVAANQFAVSGTARGGVYFGSGKGDFTSGSNLNAPVNAGVNKFTVGDFDGNGLKDVALFLNASGKSTGYVYLQTTAGQFSTSPQSSFTTTFTVQDATAADLDLDGRAEIVLTPFSAIDSTLRVYTPTVAGSFTSGDGQSFATAGVNSPVAVIDGNNNGIPDLIVGTRTNTGSIAQFQYFGNNDLPSGPVNSTITIGATPNPVTYGQPVTFSATVDQFGFPPTGSIDFYANGGFIGTAPLVGGKATLVAPGPFPVGTLNFNVQYAGDANYFDIVTGTRSITVNPLASVFTPTYSTIFADAGNGDAQSIYGGNITLTATVAPVGGFAPTGSFQFFAGATSLGTAKVDATGMATLVSQLAPVGTDEIITAVYAGDPIYASVSKAATQNLDVFILPTATQTISPSNPAVFGQPLTYTVTVFPDPAVIPGFALPFIMPRYAGSVVIFDNDNVIAVVDLDSTGKGVYALPSDYAIGNHTIQSIFTGTADLATSTSPSFVQVINKAGSQVTIAADKSAITYGQSVTLTGTASIVAPGVGFPSGTISFFQNGVSIGSGFTDVNGQVSITLSNLTAATYTFTASFSGNDQVGTSNSGTQTVTVNPSTSTITLSVVPQSSSLGTPVVVTAMVKDGNSINANVGTVTFTGTYNGAPIGPISMAVSNGTASTTLNGLLFGSGSITAAYTGTASIGDSTSSPVSFSVTKAVPTLTLSTLSPSSVSLGSAVTLTATVAPPIGVALPFTGSVNFLDGATLLATVPLSGSTASITRQLAIGGHAITAVYNGDANYSTAVSNPVGFNIFRPSDRFSVGAGPGGPDRVNVYDATGKKVFSPLYAFSPDHTSGVRVATADFDGDGVQDVAMGTGPGTGSRVRILSGVDGNVIADFSPFGDAFTGGVYVASGDVNGDLRADLVVTPDRRGGARIRVYNGVGFGTLSDFIGIVDGNGRPDTEFRGGARAAIGDINGDGFGDVVVAAGVGGGPRVATFSGKTLGLNGGVKLFGDFLAFESSLRNGSFVAAGDVNGDGLADIVAGAGPGGGPRVTIFSGAALMTNKQARVSDFFAGDLSARNGVPVALRYLDGDGKVDLIVGTGGNGDQVTAYLGSNLFAVNTAPPSFLKFNAFTGTPDPNDATRGTFVG